MAHVLLRLARDRSALLGLILVVLVVLAAVLAPVISTHPEAVWDMNPANRLKPPSGEWLLGTDRMGADIYSRVIYGARITLLIAFVAVGTSLLIGVPIGLWAGWNDFWIGEALMRISDVFLAVPQIVLAIAIAQTLGPSIENVILALSVTYWPWFARLVYAEVRVLKNETFIEAANALGVPQWRIVMQHVLPNVASPIIVRTSIGMGFNLLGDGLRDVLDPRLRRAHDR